MADVTRAYRYAAANRVSIANASFGSPSFSQAEHDATAAAVDENPENWSRRLVAPPQTMF